VSHGATSRRPVFSGTRRVRGLHERTLVDGSVVFEARLRIDGRDRWIVLDAKTKSDAIRELEALRVDRERGEQRHRSLVPTLDELADEWIAHLRTRTAERDHRRRYAPGTVDLYEQRLREHVLPRLGSRRVDELSVDDVRRLIDHLSAKPKRAIRPGEKPSDVPRVAPSTVTSCVNIVSGLLKFAQKRKLVAHNVVRDLDRDDRPGTQRMSEPRYLSLTQIALMLAAMTDTFRAVAAVCIYAGLRVSEALGLRWRDLDFDAPTIDVAGQLGRDGEWTPWTKTLSSKATIAMLPILRRELLAHRSRQASRNLALVKPDALVFTTSGGKPQSRRNALRALHRAGDKAGLNGDGRERVGVQDLRQSFVASALARANVTEATGLARHANPRVTLEMYGGSLEDGRKTGAAKLIDSGFGA
jgi:integrase